MSENAPEPPASYRSSGMPGFTEQGPVADEGWDLSLGTLRGYRWWHWSIPAHLAGYTQAPESGEFGRLVGANSCTWPDGVFEAKCTRYVPSWDDLITGREDAHVVPEYRVTCGCGFWGYWSPHTSESVIGSVGRPASATATYMRIPVFGSIKASGRVIMGTKGFRAQYAEVESLCIPDAARPYLDKWHAAPQPRPELPGSVTSHLRTDGARATWQSLQGRPQPFVEAASDVVVLARLAGLEDALGKLYPSARIVSGQQNLRALFPPEKDFYNPDNDWGYSL